MKLQNTYFIIRHGFSIPNDKKIIVSSLANGVKAEYGLADKGKQDVTAKAAAIIEKIISSSTIHQEQQQPLLQIDFISSPFSRTVETAQIILNESNLFKNDSGSIIFSPLRTDERLRERDFGALELEGDDNYHKVWEEDLKEQDENSSFKAESLASVWNRVKSLVIEEEERTAKNIHHQDDQKQPRRRAIVFVAHGDVLQITQTGWAVYRMNSGDGADENSKIKGLKDHRSLPHMHQAECRKL